MASNDSCNVGDQGPGYMSFVWDGNDGTYDFTTAYFDESSGQGWFGLYINEERKDQWTATANDNKMKTRATKSVTLKKGDEIRLDFYTQNKMRCRTDYIDIKADATGINDITNAEEMNADTRIFSIDGRYMGNDAGRLEKGIYIRNGRKFIKN